MFEISDEIYEKANVEGWLSDREGKLLYLLAKEATTGIIEIGSWKGRSTIFLGLGSQDGNKVPVFAIDRWTGSSEHRAMLGAVNTYDEFCMNIIDTGLSKIVEPYSGESKDFVGRFREKSIDLLFIDGSHEYASVIEDFEMYLPKMKDSGVVAFHDFGTPGPTQAVILNMKLFSECGRVDTLAVCRIKDSLSKPIT